MHVLKQMVRQPTALFGLIVVTLVIGLAIAAPWIAPFSPDAVSYTHLTLPTILLV